MTDQPNHDESGPTNTPRGARDVGIERDVSRSTIVTGDHNVVQMQPTAGAGPTALHQLPPPPADFTGRKTEQQELLAAIEHGGITISGLQGLGGIGKTALALKLAEQLRSRYPDAQFYLDLKGSSPKPLAVAEALAHVVRSYYPAAKLPDSETELRGLYFSVLDGQRALLLMDNAANDAQVEPLIPPESCLLLVTSRRYLILPGLAAKNLDTLSPEDARALLLTIAPRIGAWADEIATLCGRLPLPLRLAAAAMVKYVNLKPADYVRRLHDREKRLQLTASFSLSYELLSKDLQKAWRRLAVFPDSFDGDAAAVIWEVEADQAHDVLGELIAASLVEWNETSGRYRLHDLVRLFASAKLSPARRTIDQKRHAEYFLAKLEATEPYLGGRGLGYYMDLFKAEQDNMRAALKWSLENNAEMALRFAYSLSPFWNILGQLKEESTALNSALEKAPEAPMKLRMRVLGRAALRQPNSKRAKELAEQHLKLSRETRAELEEAWALENLGIIERTRGHLQEARSLERALVIFQEKNDKNGMARTLLNLCVLAIDQDEFDSALEFVTKSLDLNEELANRGELPVARTYLAFLLHKRGERKRVDELIHESLVMLRQDDRRSWLPWGLHWKGRIAIDRKEFETARNALTESLTLFQENQDSNAEIRTLLAFSWLNAEQERWERAATLLAAEESQREQQSLPYAPDWRTEIESIKLKSQESLGDLHFSKAWATGEQMSLDKAVAYAIEKM